MEPATRGSEFWARDKELRAAHKAAEDAEHGALCAWYFAQKNGPGRPSVRRRREAEAALAKAYEVASAAREAYLDHAYPRCRLGSASSAETGAPAT